MPRAFTVLVALAVVGPARGQPADDFFEKRVRPALDAHCLGCHGRDANKVKGGLNLATRAGLLAGGDGGKAVVAGDAEKSPLIHAVRYDGELKMPPRGKLPPAVIDDLTKWVTDGAHWPGDTFRGDQPRGSSALFTAEQKAFWAFQPVKSPPGVGVSIDAFLSAKRAAAGLSAAPPADPLALVRRVTFDLTGLPPTPAEIDAFVADMSPGAFAKLVDRLLASPHYGERWGRHWLDVARYADSNGLDENTAFANAYKYRDYVVRAFNADKPYDVFVREQVAGDLLPPVDDPKVQADRLTALGYLVVGAKLLAEPDKQKMLLDIADEQLDTLGKGVLGLTLGCARCHDHKFDPIPARDYYSLLGAFTSTRTMLNLNTVAKAFERPLPGTTAEQASRRKEFDLTTQTISRAAADFEKQAAKEPDAAKKAALQAKGQALRDDEKRRRANPPAAEMVLAVEDGSAAAYGTRPRNLYVQVRGNYVSPGEVAPAVFPRVLAGEAQASFVSTGPNLADRLTPNTTRFGPVRSASGRLELANWLTTPTHPLTARVFVNRVWQHHFGDGLVRTPDNFGRLGDRPTHPELLDFLAATFVADGWSAKKLHRRILLTDAYRMSTAFDPQAADIDPDNRLLWRFPRRRLEAEAVRDAMLAASGLLDRAVGGSTFTTAKNLEYVGEVSYDTVRRSLYLPVVRGRVFPMFQTFDFPDPSTMCGKRTSTVVAPQALYLMNNPQVTRYAAALAGRLATDATTDDDRVRRLYRLTVGRPATTAETARVVAFVREYATATSEKEAWVAACRAAFAASEFVYLE